MRNIVASVFKTLFRAVGTIISVAIEFAVLYLLANLMMDLFGSIMLVLWPLVLVAIVIELVCCVYMAA